MSPRAPDRSRLLIGPFRERDDAEIFVDELESVGVDAFSWTNSAGDTIEPTRHRMTLAPGLAAHPRDRAAGPHPEARRGPRGPRDIFQRDRDRIIHSVAFRRLRHKTQVFVAPDGDHFRVRLTHSIEVAQIGRTIARALGLNEDLTEALCLAHDLGHPPFGHGGEDALTRALADAGGFDHNAHTLRIVTRLETPYPDFDGLNLSWEALEGLAKHNGPVAEPDLGDGRGQCRRSTSSSTAGRASRRRSRRSPTTSPTTITTSTTGCARASSTSTSCSSCRWSRALGGDRASATRARPRDKRQRALVRDVIGTMVGDVLAETRRRVARGGRRDDRRGARRGPRAGRLLGRARRRRSGSSSASSTTGSTIRRS